jgi:peptide/nickel transport system ATP-binding protein
MAIMLITHDLGVVANRADRVVVMYAGYVVEEQPAEDLLRSARHPYTKALMGARPRRRPRIGPRPKLTDIPGRVPAPKDVTGQGCIFAPRCASALNICQTRTPALAAFGGGRRASCHLLVESVVEAAE